MCRSRPQESATAPVLDIRDFTNVAKLRVLSWKMSLKDPRTPNLITDTPNWGHITGHSRTVKWNEGVLEKCYLATDFDDAGGALSQACQVASRSWKSRRSCPSYRSFQKDAAPVDNFLSAQWHPVRLLASRL